MLNSANNEGQWENVLLVFDDNVDVDDDDVALKMAWNKKSDKDYNL